MTKKRKQYKIIAAAMAVSILGCLFFVYYGYAKREKAALMSRWDYYNAIIKSEQKWLSDIQLSNGAIPFRGEQNGAAKIVPYFSCIAAIALLKESPEADYTDTAKRYFDWHFSHLNSTDEDINGIAGTIYDYNVSLNNGIIEYETTDKKYDSVDSYAALFLSLLWEYFERTGDTGYIIAHRAEISDIVGALKATIDADGLSYVKPSYKIKYLMDNAEVNAGLSCALNLYEQALMPSYKKGTWEYNELLRQAERIRAVKDAQERAFEAVLWNADSIRYEIGIDAAGKAVAFSGWEEFYPDAVAQLFPIIFGVVSPDSERARHLYETFGEYFAWENMSHLKQGDASHYWGLTAYCGSLMRDEQKVISYLDIYIDEVIPDHDYPVYNADAAWVVLACSEMADFYRMRMQHLDPLGIVRLP